jgi:hypothetical protein
MQNNFWLFMLFLFGAIGLTSIFILINLLFPRLVDGAEAVLEVALGRSLLVGFINILFVGVVDGIVIWLTQLLKQPLLNGILVILAALLTMVPVMLIFLGLASLANLLGRRMGGTENGSYANLRGGSLLVLAGLTPFIGWFAFTPLVIMTCLGAAIQTVSRRKEWVAQDPIS